MTELDFDELDKAVNSLMADVQKPAGSPNPKPVQPSVADTSSESTPKSTISSVSSPSSSTASQPLTTKRRGQFMDVIRPASSASKSPSLARHQGVTLSPIVNSEPSKAPENATDTTSNITPSSTPEASEVNRSEWPDPIDAANEFKGGDDSNTISESSDSADAPLESPFLPDAKPEKRPLGSVQTEVDQSTISETETPLSQNLDNKEFTSSSPADVALPEELHTNLVTIESESTGTTVPVPDEIASKPIDTQPPVSVVEDSLSVPAPEAPVVVNPEPTVPAGGAIAQQYKEEPSSGDQTNGSIYDTANYHKAIPAHATGGKKSTALKWFMWVILLLILGVGGGAAAFMLTR